LPDCQEDFFTPSALPAGDHVPAIQRRMLPCLPAGRVLWVDVAAVHRSDVDQVRRCDFTPSIITALMRAEPAPRRRNHSFIATMSARDLVAPIKFDAQGLLFSPPPLGVLGLLVCVD